MKQDDLKVIAAHEAAHALVLLARGMRFEWIELSKDAKDSDTGAVMNCEQVLQGETAFSMVLSLLAGIPGARLICPQRSQLSLIMTNCMSDWAQAKAICQEQRFDAGLLLRLSSKMVRRLAPAIYRLADELRKRRRLTYEEVVGLCTEVYAEGQEFRAGLLQFSWS